MDCGSLSVSLSVCLALTGPGQQRPGIATIDLITAASGTIGWGWEGEREEWDVSPPPPPPPCCLVS